MIGGLIRDYFHKRSCPTLMRQGIQVYLADVVGVPKGKTTCECPMCGAVFSIVKRWRRYSSHTWKVDVICPGCTLEIERIDSYKNRA